MYQSPAFNAFSNCRFLLLFFSHVVPRRVRLLFAWPGVDYIYSTDWTSLQAHKELRVWSAACEILHLNCFLLIVIKLMRMFVMCWITCTIFKRRTSLELVEVVMGTPRVHCFSLGPSDDAPEMGSGGVFQSHRIQMLREKNEEKNRGWKRVYRGTAVQYT